MSMLPSHLKFAETHEWVFIDSDGLAVVGISDFAQESLGELMSITPAALGEAASAGDEVMSLESVKAASDIFSPLSGEIVAINEELEDSPELINDEPYDGGWLFKLEVSNLDELEDLMSDKEYQEQIDQS